MTLCHTPKARRIARWVSFSPTLGVKLEMLQEEEEDEGLPRGMMGNLPLTCVS